MESMVLDNLAIKVWLQSVLSHLQWKKLTLGPSKSSLHTHTEILFNISYISYIGVGDGCCRQFWDVSGGFDRFRHQHPLFLNISFGHQHS